MNLIISLITALLVLWALTIPPDVVLMRDKKGEWGLNKYTMEHHCETYINNKEKKYCRLVKVYKSTGK